MQVSGFTLIELMIVLVIIGILTTVAIPAYSQYVTKSRRASAQACLASYATWMERYSATHMTYNVGATLPALDCASAQNSGPYYTYTVANTTDSTYTVSATPTGNQATADARCGTLSIDQTGLRAASGSAGVAGCWSR
ncbi:MAG: type IV pilin protein [Nevskiaceae bacterium]|nr:MAG: type IV pilin protein [Nevskiaceae bacterium]TBR74893.1 MAG: type IV pilin protein [Nevskiaceae bacterium]